ncbi:MAG: hypothetical protein AB7P69_06810 [Candidatus Binatia bacterium]
MSAHVFGIYGFNFCREIRVGDISLIPLYENCGEARLKAEDKRIFHLTGYGKFDAEPLPETGFKYVEKVNLLQDVMTFCDQLWVLTSEYINVPIGGVTIEDSVARFSRFFDFHQERASIGPFIEEQAFCPNAREDLLNLCLTKLQDENFEQDTEFRKAFYRQIETLRLRVPFAEVIYYFVFSALEILARKNRNDYRQPYRQPNVAAVINPFLTDLGFATTQSEIEEWAALRNALFYQGQLTNEIKRNSTTIKLTEQNFFNICVQLKQLLPDVLLKLMDYNEKHINWNRWRDRKPFLA